MRLVAAELTSGHAKRAKNTHFNVSLFQENVQGMDYPFLKSTGLHLSFRVTAIPYVKWDFRDSRVDLNVCKVQYLLSRCMESRVLPSFFNGSFRPHCRPHARLSKLHELQV